MDIIVDSSSIAPSAISEETPAPKVERKNKIESPDSDNVNNLLQKWSKISDLIMRPLIETLVSISRKSVKNPVCTIFSVVIISLGLLGVGISTNFTLETKNEKLYTPGNSVTAQIDSWAKGEEPGFGDTVYTSLFANVNAVGGNVLTLEGARKMFDVLDLVREMPLYQQLCQREDKTWDDQKCPMDSPTLFWNDRESFEASIKTDDDLRKEMSNLRYANGDLANRFDVIGNPIPSPSMTEVQTMLKLMNHGLEDTNNVFSEEEYPTFLVELVEKYKLETGDCFLFHFKVPYSEELKSELTNMELEFVDRILELKQQISSSDFTVEPYIYYASSSEIVRGLIKDVNLLLIAFLVMVVFCAYALSKPDLVRSQLLLGVGAVFTIILSLASGYGLMFCIGIPLTSISALIPFALLGIGLDDMFIITGALDRTSSDNNSIEERVEKTIREIGGSISVSSITTFIAYLLGSFFSSMPGIEWFCIYAFTMIFLNFIFQLTFFVAVIAIDDRRIKSNRYDLMFCIKAKTSEKTHEQSPRNNNHNNNTSISSKIMKRYSDILLNPTSKVITIILFAALLSVGIFYASKIKTELDFRSLFPEDSFVHDYLNAIDEYTAGSSLNLNKAYFYFRDVDHSNPLMRNEMQKYIDEMVETPYVTNSPLLFWMRDFDTFISSVDEYQNLDFREQLDIFLGMSPFEELYSSDLVRDEYGNVLVSRAQYIFDEVSAYDSNVQTDAFQTQQEITMNQEVNDGYPFNKFFSHSEAFIIWQVWSSLKKEILITLMFGLLSVFFVSLIFVKHPMSACILTGVVISVFVEVIAVYYLVGMAINPLTAIGLITCLGLVVDFAIHVCLAYFENSSTTFQSNDERVKHVLMTMGKSILLGGFTTFLGVLPLAFNNILTFQTLFVTFVTITILGLMHGLILVPVLLSFIDPNTIIRDPEEEEILMKNRSSRSLMTELISIITF